MKHLFGLSIALIFVACSTTSTYRKLDQPAGQKLTANVGETLFFLNRTSDRPNVFGKADLYGEKVDRGYAELKFLGLNEGDEVILSLTDINRSASDSAMERYVAQTAGQVQPNAPVGSGSSNVETRFAFDPRKQNDLVIAGVRVIFIEVRPYSVSYRLEDTQ